MKKVVYLNEERLYQLVEQVLFEWSRRPAPRPPIEGFKWDYSNEDMYTLISEKPFDETNMDITLTPLLKYFLGVMYNKIHKDIRITNKDAAIIILFPQDNIKITIRFYFTYDATFNINGRNRTLNTVRNVRLRPGGFEFIVYKNGVPDSKMVDRKKKEWANNLLELVQTNLGRLEQ